MKIVIGGVRGTCPVSQPDFTRYGGATTSVLIEGNGGERLIIDAGTGIRELGRRIEREGKFPRVLLLFTHYHLDHVMGLPSFPLLYRGEGKLTIASPQRGGHRAKHVLSQLMAQPYWPVQMEKLESSIQFLDWPGEFPTEPFRFGNLEIRWCPVHHPGGCSAFRVDEPAVGKSFVFATDIEWDQSTPSEKAALVRMGSEPRPADLLMVDGQFSGDDYGSFVGWGHSRWEDTVDVAKQTGARALLVIHHNPENDDERLDRVDHDVKDAMPGAKLARGGMEIAL